MDTYARRMDDAGTWWRAFNGSCTHGGAGGRFNFYSTGFAGVHGVQLHMPVPDGTFIPSGKLLPLDACSPTYSCPAPVV